MASILPNPAAEDFHGRVWRFAECEFDELRSRSDDRQSAYRPIERISSNSGARRLVTWALAADLLTAAAVGLTAVRGGSKADVILKADVMPAPVAMPPVHNLDSVRGFDH